MGKSITQDMAYRQSQMKYEVNCSISGGPAGMGVWSLRSAGPGVLTVTQTSIQRQALKLIRDMRRRDPQLGPMALWRLLKQRGHTNSPRVRFVSCADRADFHGRRRKMFTHQNLTSG